MNNSIIEAVAHYAAATPNNKAIFDPEVCYTYAELLEVSKKAAYNMTKLCDIKKGDYVVVECLQNAKHLILDLACEIIGAIFVPFEKGATMDRVSGMVTETECKCLLIEGDYASLGTTYKTSDILAEPDGGYADFTYELPDGDDIAEILFSTGTTGKPKGIMISHKVNVACAENIMYGCEIEKDAVELIPLPVSHAHGIRTCYACFINGSTVGVMDGVTNVALFFKLVEEYHATALDISPTLGKMLVKIAKKGLMKYADQIKYVELGTAVLDDDLKEDLKTLLPNSRLYNFYGSTECGRSCVYDFNKEDYPKCIGYPAKNSHFFIVDENKNKIDATAENPGLVAVGGSNMMSGYFKAPELTAETVIDGVIYTTDMGYIDDKGRVFVFGRADDVINYKGIKIAPEEIEVPAGEYTGVTDCACIAIPDKMCGQAPKLFISVEGTDFDMNEYKSFLKTRLDAMRVPVAIEILDEIPRTSNGKLLRKKLREI